MKNLILTCCMIVATTCYAQEKVINDKSIDEQVPKVNDNYEYQEVVNLDSTYNKDILYKNAKIYFVDNFTSANNVIQYDSREDGRLIGKGFLTVSQNSGGFLVSTEFVWDVYFTCEITCKDSKYRYRIYDISIKETRNVNHDHLHYTWTIDEVLKQCNSGFTKKTSRGCFNLMTSSFRTNNEKIKSYMAKKIKKSDDF